MPKRPALPDLTIQQPQEQQQKMKITDTMTLVVADDMGRDFRVKQDGMLHHASPSGSTGTASPSPASAVTAGSGKAGTQAVFDRIHFDELRIGEVVGAGSQGRVRKVQHRASGEIYALKSLAFDEKERDASREAVKHELVRIAALKHENVVSSYDAYFREGKLYILMEYMDCGTMVTVQKKFGNRPFPEPRLALVAKHLLVGLAHLHASNVVHRDIKPANLLANSKGLAKISDFGVASSGESKMHMTSVGSTPYMSPERIQSEPYTTLCDIWSAGLTLAELAVGTYPFGNVKSKVFELCQLIAGGNAAVKWDLAPGHAFSDELKDFVGKCLLPVSERPSATDLMQHPFIAIADSVSLADQGRWFVDPMNTPTAGSAVADAAADSVQAA